MEGVDTVAVAVPDHVGRLIGKRLSLATWESVREHGMAMPDFHLVTGLENEPVEGLEAAGMQTGFRNGVLRPDLSSLRRLPWNDATALVVCDAYSADGVPAEVAPRWVLRRQLDLLAERGLVASMASELEFYLFRTSYAVGERSGYRRLRPAYHRHGDNDLLVDGHIEDPARRDPAPAAPGRGAGRAVAGRGRRRPVRGHPAPRATTRDGRQACRVQARRQAARGPARPVRHVHGQGAGRATGLELPRPHLIAEIRGRVRRWRRTMAP